MIIPGLFDFDQQRRLKAAGSEISRWKPLKAHQVPTTEVVFQLDCVHVVEAIANSWAD
jgi:hypothetical protein